jgi:hypothetical protein
MGILGTYASDWIGTYPRVSMKSLYRYTRGGLT